MQENPRTYFTCQGRGYQTWQHQWCEKVMTDSQCLLQCTILSHTYIHTIVLHHLLLCEYFNIHCSSTLIGVRLDPPLFCFLVLMISRSCSSWGEGLGHMIPVHPPFGAEGRMMLPGGELLIDVKIGICTNWHSAVLCFNPSSCHPLTFKSQPTSSVCLRELRHVDTRGDAKCWLFQPSSARLMIIVVVRGESHTTPGVIIAMI